MSCPLFYHVNQQAATSNRHHEGRNILENDSEPIATADTGFVRKPHG
jgi:hypothetical protein